MTSRVANRLDEFADGLGTQIHLPSRVVEGRYWPERGDLLICESDDFDWLRREGATTALLARCVVLGAPRTRARMWAETYGLAAVVEYAVLRAWVRSDAGAAVSFYGLVALSESIGAVASSLPHEVGTRFARLSDTTRPDLVDFLAAYLLAYEAAVLTT
jgi:hypothetical protein